MNGGTGPRTATVPARRLRAWTGDFLTRHPGCRAEAAGHGFTLTAPDGAWARVESLLPPADAGPWPAAGDPPDRAASALVAHLDAEREVGVLLVRRGGYGVGRLRGDRFAATKVGGRYVQGRTAAGGWSQHRFARRRDNQTAALVAACVEVAARLLAVDPLPEVLVTGGDRTLADRALVDPALARLAALPRGGHLPVGDPREAVLRAVPGLLRSARVTVHDPWAAPRRA
ncbi:MAG: acVLRF1 family peptidyl-tRNA hydrolase [Kineosporiaceae bacterium]